MLTNVYKSKHYYLHNTGICKHFMVDGKSKMYANSDTLNQNFLQRNKLMSLEFDPHILLMILTYMKQAHHI